MDARTAKKTRKLSQRQEASIAEDLGGRVQPGSGAIHGFKSDVRVMGDIRVEAKFTKAASYTLKREVLNKIIEEAGLEKALLQVCFLGSNNKPLQTFAIFPCECAMPGMPDQTQWAQWQTYGKSGAVLRDSFALMLLRHHGPIWFVFSKKEGEKHTHQWYQLLEWKDYLASREKLNA